jgi:hypothetical protein
MKKHINITITGKEEKSSIHKPRWYRNKTSSIIYRDERNYRIKKVKLILIYESVKEA